MVEVELCKQTFNDWFQTQLGSYFFQGVISQFGSKTQTGIISNYFDIVTLHSSTSNILDNDRKIFIISGRSNLVSATDNAHWQALKLEIASQLGLEST